MKSTKVTLFDVCRKTGYSTATVSRVLNHSPLVRGKTKEKVLRAIRQLDYRPSHAARALALQRTETLGVIFPHVTGSFHVEILRGIDEVAAEHGFHIQTAFSHGPRDQKTLIQHGLQDDRADALIVLNLDLPASFFKRLPAKRIPIIVVDRPAAVAGIGSITMDNEEAAGAAFLHLVRHCQKKVAILTGPRNVFDNTHRLAGCRQAARQAGVDWQTVRVCVGDFTRESGAAAVRRWVREKQVPRGIMALNDHMALGALHALREAGLRVPHDVALIGFDDIEAAQFMGLTTVRAPVRGMGRAASELAIRTITHKEPLSNRAIPAELIVRQSCGC